MFVQAVQLGPGLAQESQQFRDGVSGQGISVPWASTQRGEKMALEPIRRNKEEAMGFPPPSG